MKTKELTKIAICITLLCISAYLSFPLPFTPTMVTAQTIMINVISLVLLPTQAFLTVLLYLFIGLLGFPVFSGGMGGVGKLLGPTGGFIFAFLMAAPVMSWLRLKIGNDFKQALFITTFVGMPIIYLVGTLWMTWLMQLSVVQAFKVAVLPFLVGDCLKCLIASLLVLKLEQISPRSIRLA